MMASNPCGPEDAAAEKSFRRWIGETKSKRAVALHQLDVVFPGERARAHVPEANARVCHDFVAALPGSLTEGEVVGQIPPAIAIGADEGSVKRDELAARVGEAFWQMELRLQLLIHGPADEEKAGGGVE